MAKAPVKLQISTLPESPGVYQFYDKENKLLYVGKAINLKKRVASYFNKKHDNGRTRLLVKKIVNIKHIVVATETDALLLENNLSRDMSNVEMKCLLDILKINIYFTQKPIEILSHHLHMYEWI